MCRAASSTGTHSPIAEPLPTTKPSSASMSSRTEGPNTGAGSSAPLRWPHGRTMSMPETTIEPARPW
jgi:hypothetical protein